MPFKSLYRGKHFLPLKLFKYRNFKFVFLESYFLSKTAIQNYNM